ncbi:MAG: TolC family protein [Limisphaerales bacterium]
MNNVSLSVPLAAMLCAFLFCGCQTYHPRPLPATPDLLRSPALPAPSKNFGLGELKPRRFPTNGLDELAAVTLAVYNNPDLKAARMELGVANAQLVEAGLLPDPQVSGGVGKSPKFVGYNISLNEDLQALITRGAGKASARAHARQVHLDILWQEYQVAEKAEELFIECRADEEIGGILTNVRDMLDFRYRQDEVGLQQGGVSAVTASTDLAALAEAGKNLSREELDANQTRHDLNQLLGLEPDVHLRLIGDSPAHPISGQEFEADLSSVSRRRADLLALQAGYRSQEQTLRKAVLAQFPSVSAGVEQARDPVEGVNTIGLNVSVTLPLFNRNQGQIDIQKATRAWLYQDYQARLDQAAGDASKVWNASKIISRRLETVQASLPALEQSATAARREFKQGDLDLATYITMNLNLATEQEEAIRLQVSMAQAQSALQILLGLPLNDP